MALTAKERKQLLQGALDARSLAYAPYSSFRVGASLLLKDGQLILGANIENASYGGCICAERTALVKAATSHALSPNAGPSTAKTSPLTGQIRAIAVASDLPSGPCSPCGICRQFIREFCDLDMPIYMVWQDWNPEKEHDGEDDDDDDGRTSHDTARGYVKKTLEELLPLSFGPEELAKPRVS
ncbi:unnamed protein product [Parajaminaea phylloscopi]